MSTALRANNGTAARDLGNQHASPNAGIVIDGDRRWEKRPMVVGEGFGGRSRKKS